VGEEPTRPPWINEKKKKTSQFARFNLTHSPNLALDPRSKLTQISSHYLHELTHANYLHGIIVTLSVQLIPMEMGLWTLPRKFQPPDCSRPSLQWHTTQQSIKKNWSGPLKNSCVPSPARTHACANTQVYAPHATIRMRGIRTSRGTWVREYLNISAL
jgi:hypothetical protein